MQTFFLHRYLIDFAKLYYLTKRIDTYMNYLVNENSIDPNQKPADLDQHCFLLLNLKNNNICMYYSLFNTVHKHIA